MGDIIGAAQLTGNILDFFQQGTARREATAERAEQRSMQERISFEQDLMGARTRESQMDFLRGSLPEIEEFDYGDVDTDIYDRLRQIGVEDITQLGYQQQQGLGEAMAGRGMGASSAYLGARGRLGQRTAREVGRFEAGIAQQQADKQMQLNQLQAAESARVQAARTQQATALGAYVGPTEKDVMETFRRVTGKHPLDRAGA